MKRIFIIILLISAFSCKQKEKKERTLSDFFDEQDEIVLQSQSTNSETRLLLDFYVGMNNKQFDSITKLSIDKKLMKIKNDTTFYLIVPNKRDNDKNDFFDLRPTFRNDSLKSINCYIIEGYLPYNSYSYYFNNYKSLLTKKYGEPKLIYISKNKSYEQLNKQMYRPIQHKYVVWINDNLFVQLNEFIDPDEDTDKEYRSMTINYTSLKFKKDIINKIRKDEELKLLKERNEELEIKKSKIINDSLRTEIF